MTVPEHISVVDVEDDERLARLTQRYLESHGVVVTLARSIAEAHGGRLELTSEQGSGTRAVLALPRSVPLDGKHGGNDDARAA